jgi:hypothetical protein
MTVVKAIGLLASALIADGSIASDARGQAAHPLFALFLFWLRQDGKGLK